MSSRGLQCLRLDLTHVRALLDLLGVLSDRGEDRVFHPHPFTKDAVEKLCDKTLKDLYYLLMLDEEAIGYGMLRGWDQGYEIPSLGIAFHPDYRGSGLARMFMHFLHSAARMQGARRIMLKVYPENVPAKKLYESLGYEFSVLNGEQLKGMLELK